MCVAVELTLTSAMRDRTGAASGAPVAISPGRLDRRASAMPRARTAWSTRRCCTAWNPPIGRAERLALAGVGDGAVEHSLHAPDRIGGEQQSMELDGDAPVREPVPAAHPEGQVAAGPRDVEAVPGGVRPPVGRVGEEHEPARTRDRRAGARLPRWQPSTVPRAPAVGIHHTECADERAVEDARQELSGQGVLVVRGAREGVAAGHEAGIWTAVQGRSELHGRCHRGMDLQTEAAVVLGGAEGGHARASASAGHRPRQSRSTVAGPSSGAIPSVPAQRVAQQTDVVVGRGCRSQGQPLFLNSVSVSIVWVAERASSSDAGRTEKRGDHDEPQ